MFPVPIQSSQFCVLGTAESSCLLRVQGQAMLSRSFPQSSCIDWGMMSSSYQNDIVLLAELQWAELPKKFYLVVILVYVRHKRAEALLLTLDEAKWSLGSSCAPLLLQSLDFWSSVMWTKLSNEIQQQGRHCYARGECWIQNCNLNFSLLPPLKWHCPVSKQ